MDKKILLNDDYLLNVGDTIEMHYNIIGGSWIAAAQIALIENRINQNKTYKLLSSSYSNSELILTIRIVAPPEITDPTDPSQYDTQEAGVITTGAVIAGVSVVLGLVGWLGLDKIYKIAEAPAIKETAGNIGKAILIGSIIALIGMITKGKL